MRHSALAIVAVLLILLAAPAARADADASTPPEMSDAGAEPEHRMLLRRAAARAYEGKLLDAIQLASSARDAAHDARDAQTEQRADALAKSLTARLAHVTFVLPPDFNDPEVKFDDRTVPSFTSSYAVDPGIHDVTASAGRGGKHYIFETELTLDDGQSQSIAIVFVEDQMSELYDELQRCAMLVDENACAPFQRCLDNAKTREAQIACGRAAHVERERACRACAIGTRRDDDAPLALLFFPLLAIARRARFLARTNLRS
jgi:hypothetical protein